VHPFDSFQLLANAHFYLPLVAHHWVYETSNVLHMDISIENIMVAHRNGKVFGVLLDWDRAGVPIPRHRPRSEMKRIGSKPYMSADFYATWWTGEHLYRHDLESFYYVLAAFCAGFDPKAHTVRMPDGWWAEAKCGKADRRRNLAQYHEALFQYAAPEYRALADDWVVSLNKLFTKTVKTTYNQLTSMQAIFFKAMDDADAGLAADTADLISKYLDDRDREVTYQRFLACIGAEDTSCKCHSTSASSR
jgi:hypothetical protein